MRINRILVVCLLIMVIALNGAYSEYGAPTEFGNETTTTCYIGGDNGVVNCTGPVTASNLSGNLTWTDLYGYPVACSDGYAVTQLGDSIICTKFILSSEEGNLSVNNSVHLGGRNTTTLYNYFEGLFDLVYCKLTGCVMTGNITAPYFIGNGSLLTGIDTPTPTLQEVTDEGSTTTNDITLLKDGTANLNIDTRASSNNKFATLTFKDKNALRYAWIFRQSTDDFYLYDYLNAKFVMRYDQSQADLLLGEGGNINVGIGTTNPQAGLHNVGDTILDGDVNVTGNITLGDKITFGLGEIIDNLVDGWLGITGNLYVSGNADIEGNITGNQIYGGMYYHNHTATQLNFAIDGYFYQLFLPEATHLNGFTHEDGFGVGANLTAQVSGLYQATYMASGDGQNNHEYFTSVFINEINQDQCEYHHKISAGGDIITQNGVCLIDVVVGDKISLRTADIGNTGLGNYYSANLNLVRIGN